MLKSMTGYGRCEVEGSIFKVAVEVRSTNSRYLDIGLKLPHGAWSLEPELRRIIQTNCKRGRVEVFLKWESRDPLQPADVQLYLGRAAAAKRALEMLAREVGISQELDLGTLLSVGGLWEWREPTLEQDGEAVRQALRGALERLDQMRRTEGSALEEDLKARVEAIRLRVVKMKERIPQLIQAYIERWRERVKILSGDHPMDPGRMEQEAAIWIDRLDVTEEIVRLEVHLESFAEVLKDTGPVGKKLEFILQELNREANTIGAKSLDPWISSMVVEVKCELERIREQVQNIE